MQLHKNPPLNIVLYEPQIPPNTGNIARLCAATRCHLILLGKLGFDLSDKQLKRAGLDYWQWVSWEHFPDAEAFFVTLSPENFHFLSVHNERPYTQINPQEGDYLFFWQRNIRTTERMDGTFFGALFYFADDGKKCPQFKSRFFCGSCGL